jgi:hypothetical protein
MKLNTDVAARAVRAYFRRFGEQATQPCPPDVNFETGLVTLYNRNGPLAQYQMVGERLQWAGVPE